MGEVFKQLVTYGKMAFASTSYFVSKFARKVKRGQSAHGSIDSDKTVAHKTPVMPQVYWSSEDGLGRRVFTQPLSKRAEKTTLKITEAFESPNLVYFQDPELTSEQIAEYMNAFAKFDKNGDGVISARELRTVMRSLGFNPTEDEINQFIAEVDVDGSGTIERSEFIHFMMIKSRELDTEEEMKKVFRVFDRDGNGYINADEFKYVLTHMGKVMTDTEVEEIITEADTDGDGQINYQEFVRMMLE